jgi:hypothetical protein
MGRKISQPVSDSVSGISAAGEPNAFAAARAGNGPTGGKENMVDYFRRVYADHPQWVDLRSNELIDQRWLRDHPGYEEVPFNWQAARTNVKTELRKKKKSRNHKVRTPIEEPAAAAPKLPPRALYELEEKIDLCLMLAKQLNRDALVDVIDQLRKARNLIIRMGD